VDILNYIKTNIARPAPEGLTGVEFLELRQMLGTYCVETRGKEGDILSGKRKFINELYNMMLRSGEGTALEVRNWLQKIRDKCEGLEAVIDGYLEMKGIRDKPFETFTYNGKSFDVRNIIQAIEKKSALMWKESKRGGEGSKREEQPRYPRCAEVLMQFFNELEEVPETVREETEEKVNNYRNTHNFDQLLSWSTRKLSEEKLTDCISMFSGSCKFMKVYRQLTQL